VAPATTPPTERTIDVSLGANPKEVYADDWWMHSRPIFELHGYLRVRAELFQNFSLGRLDPPGVSLWPQPADNSYTDLRGGTHLVLLCGDSHIEACSDKTQAGANMRFRVNPELHISDNLRILSQIDMLDNLVLGSTPGGFANQPAAVMAATGYVGTPGSPYVPLGSLATTTAPPTTGINSFPNSIQVKRAWGEYATPVGQLRFGRMPSQWGLGILENSGDTYDSDWQTTIDRIMFTTGIKNLDLYFSGTWDFPNEGATSATVESLTGGQPYDLAQLDDVNQYTAMIARRRNPEMAKLDLAHGDVVLNGGAYFQYRDQYLSPATADGVTGTDLGNQGFAVNNDVLANNKGLRRGMHLYIPDLWLQLLYKKFRFEAEGTLVAGSLINSTSQSGGLPADVTQWGVATQTELKAMEDRLRLDFGFGWASGDNGLLPVTGTKNTLSPSRLTGTGATTLLPRVPGDTNYTEFRFHPDYRIDLILNREILGRIQGEYYFRPSVDYDFSRSQDGQKFGGGAAAIWTRTSSFIQSPGHKNDLGIELDFSLYYQSKDGSLNDNPDKMGGFFTMLQYGVLFPLGGLGYLPGELNTPDIGTAHVVRWYIGVLY
jgi:uncharacterized protein (TIGR04551 family)